MDALQINRRSTLSHTLARVQGGFCCMAAILATCGCGNDSNTATDVPQPVVRVARPIVRDVTEYVYFTGRTDAVQSVDLQAREFYQTQ
jgi:multidrug efflux pump subunit AcrA (membrane-fusion protein)